ncbi:MAG: DUF6378 domain-containing protein [Actinomycetota bacterium]
MSIRGELLDEAKGYIDGDRNASYGEPHQDFSRTAALWSVVFEREFTAHEVALAMILLKCSRLTWQPGKRDSWTDVAGYAGCGWEAWNAQLDAPIIDQIVKLKADEMAEAERGVGLRPERERVGPLIETDKHGL